MCGRRGIYTHRSGAAANAALAAATAGAAAGQLSAVSHRQSAEPPTHTKAPSFSFVQAVLRPRDGWMLVVGWLVPLNPAFWL